MQEVELPRAFNTVDSFKYFTTPFLLILSVDVFVCFSSSLCVQVSRALSEVFELCSKLLSLVVQSDSTNLTSADVAHLDNISKV